MTTFGIDVSHHQSGLSLVQVARESNIKFAMAKMTEGQGWKDPHFPEFRRQAEASGLLFAGYHFLRSDSTVDQQAQNVKQAIGDHSIPVIIDAERVEGGHGPRITHINGFRAALKRAGLRCSPLLYLPWWYWTEIGAPNVSEWDIWQSSYGDNDGKYPGDGSERWNKRGSFDPKVLQYTSAGRVAGWGGGVDLNAFRGDREELKSRNWFKDYAKDDLDMDKKELQAAVAETPIVVNTETNEEQPLGRVLRTLLNRSDDYNGPSPKQIAAAVEKVLPAGSGASAEQIEQAVANVLQEGTDAH